MVKEKDGSVLYAVYGTLRNGCGNHYLLNQAEFLGTINTPPNFKMYSNGGFPIVSSGNNSVVVEIYKTNNPNIIRNVNGLEGYTGVRNHPNNWYDTVSVETPWGEANMFFQNEKESFSERLFVIESGDWKNQ